MKMHKALRYGIRTPDGWLARSRTSMRTFAASLLLGTALIAGPRHATATAAGTIIYVVASTNVYADVISQLGGGHVQVMGILSNPNADPHTYESSTTDAAAVARATLVVQNGLGYDDFMGKLEGTSPNRARVVIDVGAALGYKTGDNPHLWYKPDTMLRVAPLIVAALARQDPADKNTFAANLRAFTTSLQPWFARIAAIKKQFAGVPVAVTEPVFDYTALAAGLRILTPPTFQAAIMGGSDPSPQDVQRQKDFFSRRQIKAFFYNQQAAAPITSQLLSLARVNRIPVIGVYETKPLHKTYQQWMIAETSAVQLALSRGISTERIS
ncbi:MAG TPA: zinc ABC transporter substrate-binding protein [Chloroflexota bacterium]|nr:zinc ABC transporter substrate-binding protein [Chloroflexota bacterium]